MEVGDVWRALFASARQRTAEFAIIGCSWNVPAKAGF